MTPLTTFMDSLLMDSCSSFEIMDDNAKLPCDARVSVLQQQQQLLQQQQQQQHEAVLQHNAFRPNPHRQDSSKRLTRWDSDRKCGSEKDHLVTPKRCRSPKRFDYSNESPTMGLRMPLRRLNPTPSVFDYPFDDDEEFDICTHSSDKAPVSTMDLVQRALEVCTSVPTNDAS